MWIIIAAAGGEHRDILDVNQYGYVSDRRGPLSTARKAAIGIAVALFVFWLIGAINTAGGHQ
jgi:hypothetical protein